MAATQVLVITGALDQRKLGRGSWGVSQQGRATTPRFLLSLNPFLSEYLPTSELLSLNYFSWSGLFLCEPPPLFQLLPYLSPPPPLISTPSLGPLWRKMPGRRAGVGAHVTSDPKLVLEKGRQTVRNWVMDLLLRPPSSSQGGQAR